MRAIYVSPLLFLLSCSYSLLPALFFLLSSSFPLFPTPAPEHVSFFKHIKHIVAALTHQTVITLHIILYFTDSLPLLPTAFSIFSHLIYLQNFSSSWPYISLTSLKFLASCVLVVADHFTWFFHFAQRAQEQKKWKGPKYRYGSASATGGSKGSGYAAGEETFMDIAAFFAVCVWFVPLFLFLSLSANDNALPSLSKSSPIPVLIYVKRKEELTSDQSVPPTPSSIDLASPSDPITHIPPRTKSSLVKSILNPVIDYLPKLGSNRTRAAEGIIAPRTPVRGSPLHTPVNMSIQTNYFPWNGSEEGSSISNSNSNSNSNSRNSPVPGSMQIGIGKGRPTSIKTPPPPRRVQSEMMTSGLNPRGIATRNGAPAVPDAAGVGEDMKRARGTRTPSRPSTPSMSLGPDRGEALGRVEIVDTKGVAQPKRKDD
jgi:hypothetical protein